MNDSEENMKNIPGPGDISVQGGIKFSIDDNGKVTSNHVYLGNVKNKTSIETDLNYFENKFRLSQGRGNNIFSAINLKNIILLMMKKIKKDHCE